QAISHTSRCRARAIGPPSDSCGDPGPTASACFARNWRAERIGCRRFRKDGKGTDFPHPERGELESQAGGAAAEYLLQIASDQTQSLAVGTGPAYRDS